MLLLNESYLGMTFDLKVGIFLPELKMEFVSDIGSN